MCMTQKPQYKNIPSECKMPDLSDLRPLRGRLLVLLMVGGKGLSQNTSLYIRNFVRLLDKSLEEYGEARETILAQIEEGKRPPGEMMKQGRILHILAFTDHIETCINAIARLYKLLDGIKSEPESPTLPRETRRLVETQTRPIKDIRDTIEHMDERIQKGELAPGKPIMPVLSENDDSVVVSNHEIKFKELSMILRTMHEIAQYILTVKKQKS